MTDFLKTKDAAEFLGIKPVTLYKLTSNRKIPFYRPNGKLMYFAIGDLVAYITRYRNESI
ncbi:MAG: helix-turn-helix domain-containing protein [Bacteroidetes bacterium]|nr:helix-turn-helix domain-containing protein [Bacteroidota bacterium]